MPHQPPSHHHRSAQHLRQIGLAHPVVICQLLPVEQFLIWALRAWIQQSIYLDLNAQALRWKLTELFLMFGIAERRREFEQAADVLTKALAREVDFHSLGCPCVGDDECRWLHALGALQRGARAEATAALEHYTTPGGANAALDLVEPLTQALREVGWMLPPWREASVDETAAHAPTPSDQSTQRHLRLVFSRSDDSPACA